MNTKLDFGSKDEAFYVRQQNVPKTTEENWQTILYRMNNIKEINITPIKFDGDIITQIIIEYGHIYRESGIMITYDDIKHLDINDIVQKFVWCYFSDDVPVSY